jgi:Secretion system C-terminal sorting domain
MKKIIYLLPILALSVNEAKSQSLPVGVTGANANYQSVTVSINELSLERAISIYPNPALGELSVKQQDDFDFNGAELSIQDIRGRVVLTESNVHFKNEVLKINTQKLSPGIYTLYLRTNNKNVTAYKKFVVSEK